MHFHFHPSREGASEGGGSVSLPLPSELSQDFRLLEPEKVRFRWEGGRLQMLLEGEEEWREITLVRLFPLSEPEGWLSVLDREGKEVGILMDARRLAPESLACVREELRRRYVVPQILRILACREKHEWVEWTVETDRGRTTFLTRRLREQVQQPLPRRLVLVDVEGNRYDIPDVEALPPESRRWLEEQI